MDKSTVINSIELALSEFSIRNLEMNSKCRHSLTIDGQEIVYNILKAVLDSMDDYDGNS